MNARVLVLALALPLGCDAAADDNIPAVDTEGVDPTPIERTCPEGSGDDRWADCVEAFEPGPEAGFGHDAMPEVVLGPPVLEGGGGSLDVASLGCGGMLTLAFDEPGIVDGEGPDFIVYENPFAHGDITFAEPARVLVSEDGEDWRAFACTLTGAEDWPPTGCAGINPVTADGDVFEGGDAFDLADVGLKHARYVRLVDVSEAYFGNDQWCRGPAGGFDLDAVEALPR